MLRAGPVQGNEYRLDQPRGSIWGAGSEAGPVLGGGRGPGPHSGAASGEAAAPAYRLAVQALQVDDEELVVFLAPGDFPERRGSLAQQLLLRQLANTGEGGNIIRTKQLI